MIRRGGDTVVLAPYSALLIQSSPIQGLKIELDDSKLRIGLDKIARRFTNRARPGGFRINYYTAPKYYEQL